MSSKGKRLKRTALAIPPIAPAALATVAMLPVGAAPVGRQASECGMKEWVGNLGKGNSGIFWRNSQNEEVVAHKTPDFEGWLHWVLGIMVTRFNDLLVFTF